MGEKPYNDYMTQHRKQKETPVFPGYTGKRSWNVKHQDYGELNVIAPSLPTAIATAAGIWGQRWQKYEFYANCNVEYIGTEGKKK